MEKSLDGSTSSWLYRKQRASISSLWHRSVPENTSRLIGSISDENGRLIYHGYRINKIFHISRRWSFWRYFENALANLNYLFLLNETASLMKISRCSGSNFKRIAIILLLRSSLTFLTDCAAQSYISYLGNRAPRFHYCASEAKYFSRNDKNLRSNRIKDIRCCR